jgi:tetratricopeptide (TPR) repeat protein
LLGTLVLAGFYGAGLLGESLRQYTLVLRFEYWRAGVKMGLDNLLFGLGYDNYGDYFQEYRSSKVALMTGVELTTNNAHNPFVQQFATLGLSGLVVILAPFVFATFLGLKRFLQRSSNLEQSMIFILFISLWSMAFFSIDNLSIAVINWFVLGAILGILKKSPENYQVRESTPKSKALRQPLLIEYRKGLAIGLVGIAFAFSWGSSSANRTLAETFSKNVSQEDPEALNRRQLALLSVTENPMSRETEFKWAAEGFLNMGLREAAEKTLVIGIRKFPRDMILLDNLAYLLEQNGDYNSAITLRVRQLEIEKRNWRIYYYLALSLNKQTKTSEALNYLRKTENLEDFISAGDLKTLESFKEELKLSRSEG